MRKRWHQRGNNAKSITDEVAVEPVVAPLPPTHADKQHKKYRNAHADADADSLLMLMLKLIVMLILILMLLLLKTTVALMTMVLCLQCFEERLLQQ